VRNHETNLLGPNTTGLARLQEEGPADIIGCLIYGIFMVALIGGGLWLAVATVKWMRQHS
jgi:hypothetical protein